MTEQELMNYSKRWHEENRERLLGSPDGEADGDSDLRIFSYIIRIGVAVVAENNRVLTEKLKRAGINLD